MSNTLGTVAASGHIIQEALDMLVTERPLLSEIALDLRNFDGTVDALLGQTITTRVPTIPTVEDFGSAASAKEDSDVTVTLTDHKQVRHEFTQAEIQATNRELIQESAKPIMIAMSNYIVDAVAALWTKANFPYETIKASGWSYETLVAIDQAMADRGVPQMARFLCVNSAVYAALQQDTLIVAALNNPANGNAIATGKLPRVLDFSINRYPAIPSTENKVGFAGYKGSCVYAQRAPKDLEGLAAMIPFPGNRQIIEGANGMAVMVNEWINPSDRKINVRVDWLHGVAKGSGNTGQRLVTAAA